MNIDVYSSTKISAENHKCGNFVALLQYTAACDDLLNEHLRLSSKKRLYISKDPQNHILELAASQITDCIIEQIQQAGMYSIMLDECGDASNTEQLALTVRYVYDSEVQERFLTIVECNEGTSGESIGNMVMKIIDSLSLRNCSLVALTTDGAANMTGKVKGVGAILQQKYPQLQHIHCLAHVLNLTVMETCKNSLVKSMFSTVQSTHAFFSMSPKRSQFLNKVIEQSNSKGELTKKKLKDVCRTRWVERYTALETMLSLYTHVVECMEEIVQDTTEWSQETRNKANILLDALTSYKFIVSLVITTNILVITKGLCHKLQGRSYDIVQALDDVDATISKLQSLRESCFYEDNSDIRIWFEDIDELAESHDIQAVMPRMAKKQVSQLFHKFINVMALQIF
jgi:hypothetical protein